MFVVVVAAAVIAVVFDVAVAITVPYHGIDSIHSRFTDPSLVAVIK